MHGHERAWEGEVRAVEAASVRCRATVLKLEIEDLIAEFGAEEFFAAAGKQEWRLSYVDSRELT